MLSKHVDVIAILAIVLGLLVFTRTPQLRISERLNAAEIRIHRAIEKSSSNPLRRIVTRLAQEAR